MALDLGPLSGGGRYGGYATSTSCTYSARVIEPELPYTMRDIWECRWCGNVHVEKKGKCPDCGGPRQIT